MLSSSVIVEKDKDKDFVSSEKKSASFVIDFDDEVFEEHLIAATLHLKDDSIRSFYSSELL